MQTRLKMNYESSFGQKSKLYRKLESQWFLVASVCSAKEYRSQAEGDWFLHCARITERAFVYFQRIIKS